MGAKQRDLWLDFCKGLAIIFILAGHRTYASGQLFHNVVFSFNLPIFLIISGYLYNNEKWQAAGFKAFAQSRFRSYVIPYFILGACSTAVQFAYSLLQGIGFKSSVYHTAKMAFGILYSNGVYMGNALPLWFLPLIFIIMLLFFGIMRCQKVSTRIALYTLCGAIGFAYNLWFPCDTDALFWTRTPWHLAGAFTSIPVIAFGYAVRKYHLLEKANWLTVAASVAIAGYAICTNVDIAKVEMVNIQRNMVHNPLLAYVGMFAACFTIFWLCRALPKTGKLIPLLGRNTVLIMFLDFWIREAVKRLSARLGLALPWTVQTLIAVAVCVLASLLWEALKKKYPKIALF